MNIDFAIVKGWEIPQGIVKQITDASGRVLWCAVKKVKVTITSLCEGISGNTGSITVTSDTPFAPDPTNPSYKVTSWTVEVWEEPNCTIELPVGSTIECTVSDNKQSNRSYIKLNGVKVVNGKGSYIYTVNRDVTINIVDKYEMGEYSMITILEDGIILGTILEVEKITSDTYAGSTTYTGETFILLDIYPKTNGTVKVTYGGLTKTITDTSGAEEPNAQQVFFGTFNGVTDETETPESGTLTIEGDYYAFGCGAFAKNKSFNNVCICVTAIDNFGTITKIPDNAFYDASTTTGAAFEQIVIPKSVTWIGNLAFYKGVTNVVMVGTVPPELNESSFKGAVFGVLNEPLKTITVPKGYGNVYKEADTWAYYSSIIVEES